MINITEHRREGEKEEEKKKEGHEKQAGRKNTLAPGFSPSLGRKEGLDRFV